MDQEFDFEGLRGKMITVEGTIAAGKTSWCKWLCDLLNEKGIPAVVAEEKIDHSWLGKFIEDKKRWAFSFQLDMLRTRQVSFMMAQIQALSGTCVIADRGLRGDRVFLEVQKDLGNIDDDEYKIYVGKYDDFCTGIADHTVYLRVPNEVAKARTIRRNREHESGYDEGYMYALNKKYDEYFANFPGVITVDWGLDMWRPERIECSLEEDVEAAEDVKAAEAAEAKDANGDVTAACPTDGEKGADAILTVSIIKGMVDIPLEIVHDAFPSLSSRIKCP